MQRSPERYPATWTLAGSKPRKSGYRTFYLFTELFTNPENLEPSWTIFLWQRVDVLTCLPLDFRLSGTETHETFEVVIEFGSRFHMEYEKSAS